MPNPSLSALQINTASGLHYRLRLPTPAKPTQLLVLLHGVGGNESNLLDLASGIDPATLVVLARGPLQLGPQQFAWFQVRFTEQGPQIEADQAERSRQLLIALLQQLQTQHGIAPEQSVVAGFSQGGIMSASVALSAPQSVKGFALLSGRILPELAAHIAPREQLANIRAFIGHGEQDSTLPVLWAQRSDALLNELGVPHTLHLYPTGHTIGAGMQADFGAWLASA
jgi:phospholipase/carboxylesterase